MTENFSVTAGHCERDAVTGRGSTGDAWSEYKLAPLGYAMGSSTRNSFVNEGSDGLRIPIKSTDASQRVAITSTNDRIIIVRQGSGEDVLNERICMSGAVTGGEVCGVLLSRTHTITHGGMTFRNQRVASYPNQQGDSGGSILYGSTGKGVNSGMLTYAGAWRSFYSQIQIVLAQLDLTNLTGIS